MPSPDKEIFLLEVLKAHPDTGQRDMAEALGLSLGMTNMLLKELSAKGWMLMRRLDSRKVQYALTSEGLKELSRRSYRYLKKTIRHVADCRTQLESLVLTVQAAKASGLNLVGSSDLDFVLESLCRQHRLDFQVTSEPLVGGRWFVVYAEARPHQQPNVLDYMAANPLRDA